MIPSRGPSPELPPGATTVETDELQRFKKVLLLAVKARRNLLLTGPAGCGKTHAVRYILRDEPFYEVRFEEKLNRRSTLNYVHRAVTGSLSDRTLEQIEDDLYALLRDPIVLVLEEVQYLNETQMHLVRTLYDRPETKVVLIFVGEPEAAELVNSIDSLHSRVRLHVSFEKFEPAAMPSILRLYHPMYERLSDRRLLRLNKRLFDGQWRHVEAFTSLAVEELPSSDAPLSDDVVERIEDIWNGVG